MQTKCFFLFRCALYAGCVATWKAYYMKESCKFSSSTRKIQLSKFEVVDSTEIHLMHTIHCQVHHWHFNLILKRSRCALEGECHLKSKFEGRSWAQRNEKIIQMAFVSFSMDQIMYFRFLRVCECVCCYATDVSVMCWTNNFPYKGISIDTLQ